MISVFDLFKIGIGPSSSHTVGPMVAGKMFLQKLHAQNVFTQITRIHCELFGSLGATGRGHHSDVAVMLGLMGETPDDTDTSTVQMRIEKAKREHKITLDHQREIDFNYAEDIVMHLRKSLPYHPNAMTIRAYSNDKLLCEATYYSVGGGFVLNEEAVNDSDELIVEQSVEVPYPFANAADLLRRCEETGERICDIVYENEKTFTPEAEIYKQLDRIWSVMQACVNNGLNADGVLPGGLNLERRSRKLYQTLLAEKDSPAKDLPFFEMDWVNLYALAVNEENAGGGRVVTAPTNGAAGVIPAVMHYYRDFCDDYSQQGAREFLLTSAAIGIIIKQNASISGAEVGCQGEVGSACAMAAAGLTEVLGGTSKQITNAAEIGIEHNLGLTCDPIGGLVQVPCIERNAIAAVKAINASRLARRGNGQHFVSLDKAIKTMKDTGADMMEKYKETSRGGLAVNVIEVPVNFVDC